MPPVDAPGQGPSALTVSEVAVRFGGVSALGSVSISVPPGSVTGLIGPNGAGKTTLFNVISGLQAPERGRVALFDVDVTSMKPHHRARLGLARTFQRLEVFGTLSASENVQVGLESDLSLWNMRRWRRFLPGGKRPVNGSGDRNGSGDQNGSGAAGRGQPGATTCDRLLSGVGLAGLGSRQASAMSTGLARMVELARALAIGPKLLLLDEPGSGLDETESAALGELLSKLAAGGMAVLLVEHDMELVMRVCDHIYVLDFGDIIASGTPEQIRHDPMVQAAYLGAVDSTAGGDPSTGQPPSPSAPVGPDPGPPR